MLQNEKIQELKLILKHSSHIRILSHRNPDGDAIGSMLAFTYICDFFKVPYDLILVDSVPKNLTFLPRINQICSFDPQNISQTFANEQTNTVVFLDCGQMDRAGSVYESVQPHQTIINIDHHMSNPLFGHFNLIENITSTCELVYHIIKDLEIPLSFELALCLYVGILTDTGAFQFDKVNASTHMVIAELLSHNVQPFEVFHQIYQTHPIVWLEFLKTALNNIEFYYDNSTAILCLPQELLSSFNDKKNNHSDSLFTIITSVDSIRVCAVIKEKEDGTIAASLRSKDNIDVSQIAMAFGGGGHKHAAGCRTSSLSILEFKQALLSEITVHL
ncbi:MAG: DHH family phosphoesterase [Brevinemataceae bacterium]